MADSHFNAAPRTAHATPYPMARPGYGKRSTPGRVRPTAQDFAHLPAREAAVAAFIDRLPDGTDISVKGLAKVMPYGQCALRTALNALQRAGHLRRGVEHLVQPTGARWVTRTWFSRTARDGDWWGAFVAGDVVETGEGGGVEAERVPEAEPEDPPDEREDPVPAPVSVPVDRPVRSAAFEVLAAVGRRNPAVSLSASDCAALEPLAATWLERGATEEVLLCALTDGLPSPVHHPAGLLRNRLVSKLPPTPATSCTTRVARSPLRILECAKCGVPGRPEALEGGECGPCRGEVMPPRRPGTLPPDKVSARAAEARAAAFRPVVAEGVDAVGVAG
jgi:hypothetical protein